MKSSKKPELRILHHMARSGGTVLSKCLGCMDNVVLLSEIHPFGAQIHNPLQQANDWFHLFAQNDLDAFKDKQFTFVEVIEMIRKRAEASGKYLVIRDWSHLDFTGVPFIEKPAYKLTSVELLKSHYSINQASTVRHPIDQWISLNKLSMFDHVPRLSARDYIHGYLRFAEIAAETGYVRYEDFTQDSDVALQRLCKELRLPFDSEYKNKWYNYKTITGNNTTPSESRFVEHTKIEALPRQQINQDIIEEFIGYPDYLAAIELLGYSHDDST